MPRKLRLEYPGAIHHVMSRGDQRQDIFLDEVDQHDFIKTLEWTQNELATGQKSHPIKLALAARLRRETTLSVRQIAERMNAGKPGGSRTNPHKFMNNPQPGGPEAQSDLQ
ncbi:MAG: hypothetical protein NTX27_05780 [Verrucomicrobia bacterium]|nr:hypothetical protein [Verrucomicrobiota bacterium]